MPEFGSERSPESIEFVVLSFEGPDPYAQAGGLGVRVTELSRTLAQMGFMVHQYFVGDPNKPPEETHEGGRWRYHRWCQWISRYYPSGVYDGEEAKLYDFNETIPWHVMERVVRPTLAAGRNPVILAEEWHTADLMGRLSDLLHWHGLRRHTIFVWNANNTMGFERINWGRLSFISTLTTVSHYMKHRMWGVGANPIVIPNGIPARLLADPPAKEARELRDAVQAPLVFFKIGRFDPDKRWHMAIDAVALLKRQGESPKLLIRGGIEAHGAEVLASAHRQGLTVADIYLDGAAGGDVPSQISRLAAAFARHRHADILNLRFFLPEPLVRALYLAADAVLANSGMEPFGLVGLEAMAAGGVAFTGATGEEYARAFANAIVLETADPREIASYAVRLLRRPEDVARIRAGARETAAAYTWENVIRQLLYRLEFIALQSEVSTPQPDRMAAAVGGQ